jgi:hypothetical protein
LHGVGRALPFLRIGAPAEGVLPVAAALRDGQVGHLGATLCEGGVVQGLGAGAGGLGEAGLRGGMRGH